MGSNNQGQPTAGEVRARLEWFKAEILPHEAALRARLRRILPGRADLDDIAAEAMARAFATPDFARISAGRAWLFRLARNLFIDQARRSRIVAFEALADYELIADSRDSEAALEARDALRRLQTIIEGLPIQCRRAFILRRIYERPVAEIAETMNLSVSTVDKHIARATAKVMTAMAEFGDLDIERSGAEPGERGIGSVIP